jgi:hypothetical protein
MSTVMRSNPDAEVVVRTACRSEARLVHDLMNAISWINETTKSDDGLANVAEFCDRGDIFVSATNQKIAAVMVLLRDHIAADFGRKLWSIPLISTIKSERRKGHARMLVKKAKEIVGSGVIQAHPQNDKSRELLISEGFVHIDGETDMQGYPLYQWSPG